MVEEDTELSELVRTASLIARSLSARKDGGRVSVLAVTGEDIDRILSAGPCFGAVLIVGSWTAVA